MYKNKPKKSENTHVEVVHILILDLWININILLKRNRKQIAAIFRQLNCQSLHTPLETTVPCILLKNELAYLQWSYFTAVFSCRKNKITYVSTEDGPVFTNSF